MDIPQDPIWVDTPRELDELCQSWRQQAAIAVDTEFMRSDTFYPIAGLIQIGDGRGCYLIDPLVFDDLEPLAELMSDESVTKVLHACSEDLEVFAVLLGVLPSPVFDTQIGAAFAGLGFSLGYAGLARELLGVEIPKGETRSDWLQRPLSAAQLKYAALDVAHLLIVYGKLLSTLKEQDRMDWVRDDCARLVEAARAEPDFDRHYHKLGQAWRLSDQALPVLQRLCRWREETARERDMPRNRLIKDQPLQEMARQQPTSLNKLRRIDGIPKRTVNDDGDHLLDLIRDAREAAPVERPPSPLGRAQGDFLKSLKRYVRERAESLGLPPELLIRKKEYEALVRSGLEEGEYRLPERLRGWRYDVIGQGLLDRARQWGREETS